MDFSASLMWRWIVDLNRNSGCILKYLGNMLSEGHWSVLLAISFWLWMADDAVERKKKGVKISK